jgi:hypothetical protein
VQRCSIADARLRRMHASKFLEVAELVAMEQQDLQTVLRQASGLVEFAQRTLDA